MELIFQLQGDSSQGMSKDDLSYLRPPIFIGGLHNQSYFVQSAEAHYQSVGIKLVPEAAKVVLGINVNELKNQIIDAHDIFDFQGVPLLDQLLTAEDQVQQIALLYQWLSRQLAHLPSEYRPLGLDVIWASQGRVRVSDLAKKSYNSPSNYRKRFRESIGLSPSEYLKLVRVRSSLRQMQNPQVPIQQIAYNLGYFDPAHFSREFKAILQYSPRAYRQSLAPH